MHLYFYCCKLESKSKANPLKKKNHGSYIFFLENSCKKNNKTVKGLHISNQNKLKHIFNQYNNNISFLTSNIKNNIKIVDLNKEY